MQHTPAIQAIADQFAQAYKYKFAEYIGKVGANLFVYQPWQTCNTRSEKYPTGLPAIITVEVSGNQCHSTLIHGSESLQVLQKMKPYENTVGCRIYQEYRRKVRNFECEDEAERQYMEEIVFMGEHELYESRNIELTDIYRCLELADRMNRRIAFSPCPETMDCLDGWEYYIKLTKPRKPKK